MINKYGKGIGVTQVLYRCGSPVTQEKAVQETMPPGGAMAKPAAKW